VGQVRPGPEYKKARLGGPRKKANNQTTASHKEVKSGGREIDSKGGQEKNSSSVYNETAFGLVSGACEWGGMCGKKGTRQENALKKLALEN